MPDISMCQNDKCKVNKQCYRYMAIPSGYQSYADFNQENCGYFMPIDDRRITKKGENENEIRL